MRDGAARPRAGEPPGHRPAGPGRGRDGQHRLDELAAEPLRHFTDRTITDPWRLRTELAAVRERGYATAVDEFEVGLTAVAAPIAGSDGTVVASISASGPTFRIAPDRIPAVAAQVRTTATDIARRLGWTGQP